MSNRKRNDIFGRPQKQGFSNSIWAGRSIDNSIASSSPLNASVPTISILTGQGPGQIPGAELELYAASILGATGGTSATGLAGATGPVGPTGSVGPQGIPGGLVDYAYLYNTDQLILQTNIAETGMELKTLVNDITELFI